MSSGCAGAGFNRHGNTQPLRHANRVIDRVHRHLELHDDATRALEDRERGVDIGGQQPIVGAL